MSSLWSLGDDFNHEDSMWLSPLRGQSEMLLPLGIQCYHVFSVVSRRAFNIEDSVISCPLRGQEEIFLALRSQGCHVLSVVTSRCF